MTEVGIISSDDLDAQRTFVRGLDAKLAPAVAKCFASDAATVTEWNDLHHRVGEYLDGWTLGIFTSMFYDVGKNLIAQLNAWLPRVAAKGCPVDAPGPEPTPTPGLLEQAAALMPASLEQAAVIALAFWWLSKKVG